MLTGKETLVSFHMDIRTLRNRAKGKSSLHCGQQGKALCPCPSAQWEADLKGDGLVCPAEISRQHNIQASA